MNVLLMYRPGDGHAQALRNAAPGAGLEAAVDEQIGRAHV